MLFIKDSNWIFFILSLVFLQLPVNQVSEKIKPVEFVLDGSWYLSKHYSYNLHSQTISIIQQLEKGFTARFRKSLFWSFFFSNLWITSRNTNLRWFRGTSRSLAVASHAEVHSLWPYNVLWRFPYIASLSSYHSLLYLWEEDVKHLWHQMYSNIRYLRECVDETIAENQYAYLKNKLQAVLHKDTILPVNNHIADIR